MRGELVYDIVSRICVTARDKGYSGQFCTILEMTISSNEQLHLYAEWGVHLMHHKRVILRWTETAPSGWMKIGEIVYFSADNVRIFYT